MEGISFTAHVSNKKSAITSKSKLAGVAKHNLRKYKSEEYSAENIFLIYGTDNLVQDVKAVYHQEFDEAVKVTMKINPEQIARLRTILNM